MRPAAKLVKASIREFIYNNEEYPSDNVVADINTAKQWLPTLLQEFLGGVVCDEPKHVAVGHTIVQAARPCTAISPVLYGMGVSVDHVLGSKWMIQMLPRLGFPFHMMKSTSINNLLHLNLVSKTFSKIQIVFCSGLLTT